MIPISIDGTCSSNETGTEDNPYFLAWSRKTMSRKGRANLPPARLEHRPWTTIENHRGKKGTGSTIMLPKTILPIIKELQGYTIPQKFPMMIPIPIKDTQILK